MGKVYIIYYDFENTSGNHAGMAYLSKTLERDSPQVKAIKSVPHNYTGGRYIAKTYAVLLAIYFKIVLKKEDRVFFFEYLTKGSAYQALTAHTMRFLKIKQPIYGLIHLSGRHLKELYGDEKKIKKGIKPLDKIFVFGSTLRAYFKELGFKKEIVNSFHFVDTDYYRPPSVKVQLERSSLQVICIGYLKRNFDLLWEIISKSPDINFHVLVGTKKLDSSYDNLSHVKTYPFLSEDEMLSLMQKCDVSLSVMKDTVGSNVITTTMAVGLVQVISDVGSIRDYCDEENSFLCTQKSDYIHAFQTLDNDRNLLEKMKQASLKKAKGISKESFVEHFENSI